LARASCRGTEASIGAPSVGEGQAHDKTPPLAMQAGRETSALAGKGGASGTPPDIA
jgi:hypothetical protein